MRWRCLLKQSQAEGKGDRACAWCMRRWKSSKTWVWVWSIRTFSAWKSNSLSQVSLLFSPLALVGNQIQFKSCSDPWRDACCLVMENLTALGKDQSLIPSTLSRLLPVPCSAPSRELGALFQALRPRACICACVNAHVHTHAYTE